jgi:hypothetical protein
MHVNVMLCDVPAVLLLLLARCCYSHAAAANTLQGHHTLQLPPASQHTPLYKCDAGMPVATHVKQDVVLQQCKYHNQHATAMVHMLQPCCSCNQVMGP